MKTVQIGNFKMKRKSGSKKSIITILFIIYIMCVLRITVFRSGVSVHNLFSGRINMSLFQSYIPLIQEKNWFRIIYLFGGNIVWFIPLGMYLQWFKSKRSLWEIVVFGFLFSFFIETMQYILSSGVSELDDLILNTIGAVAGALIIRIIWRR